MLTVDVASTNRQLTRLDTIKRELEIDSTNIDDDKIISDLIDQASAWIVSHTNREFAKETITQTMQSRGTPYLLVDRTPLRSILFIEFSGTSVESTLYEIEDPDAGLIWKQSVFTNTIMPTAFITEGPTRYGRQTWTVKYVGGYTLPGTTGGRDLPHDVERACLDLVKSWFISRGENPEIQRQQVGDASETKFAKIAEQGIAPTVLNILKPFVRYEINRYG